MVKMGEQERNEEDAMFDNMAAQGGGYVREQAPTDQGRLIQFIHSVRPHKTQKYRMSDGKIKDVLKEGDIPEDIFKDNWGYTHHLNSLTFIPEHKVDLFMADYDIAQLSTMMSQPRSKYTPRRNADIDQMEHLIRCEVYAATNGFGRIMGATQRFEHEQRMVAQRVASDTRNKYLSNLRRQI